MSNYRSNYEPGQFDVNDYECKIFIRHFDEQRQVYNGYNYKEGKSIFYPVRGTGVDEVIGNTSIIQEINCRVMVSLTQMQTMKPYDLKLNAVVNETHFDLTPVATGTSAGTFRAPSNSTTNQITASDRNSMYQLRVRIMIVCSTIRFDTMSDLGNFIYSQEHANNFEYLQSKIYPTVTIYRDVCALLDDYHACISKELSISSDEIENRNREVGVDNNNEPTNNFWYLFISLQNQLNDQEAASNYNRHVMFNYSFANKFTDSSVNRNPLIYWNKVPIENLDQIYDKTEKRDYKDDLLFKVYKRNPPEQPKYNQHSFHYVSEKKRWKDIREKENQSHFIQENIHVKSGTKRKHQFVDIPFRGPFQFTHQLNRDKSGRFYLSKKQYAKKPNEDEKKELVQEEESPVKEYSDRRRRWAPK